MKAAKKTLGDSISDQTTVGKADYIACWDDRGLLGWPKYYQKRPARVRDTAGIKGGDKPYTKPNTEPLENTIKRTTRDMRCRKICQSETWNYKPKNLKPCRTNDYYKVANYCKTCAIWLNTKGCRCPCCSFLVRTAPRASTGTKKRQCRRIE